MNQPILPGIPSPPCSYDFPRLRDLPIRERPVTRISHLGPSAVSLTELLATVIGGDRQLQIAQELVVRYQNLANMVRANLVELARINGMGPSRAAALQAAFELGRRMITASSDERPQVRTPNDVGTMLIAEMGHLEQEHFWVLLLDIRNHILAVEQLYKGSLDQTQVRVGEVFREAVRRNSAAIIVVHNHPSGDPTPSPEDIAVTRDLVAAGKLLRIELLDHLIIGQGRWVSLRERGLGF